MSICRNCGVEIDDSFATCPLCFSSDKLPDKKQEVVQAKQTNPGYSPLTRKEKGRLFWELSSLLLFSAFIVTLMIDLIHSGRSTWSRYVLVSLTAAFLYITMTVFSIRRLWLFLPSLMLVSAGLLLSIDYFDGGIDWVVHGLPMAGSFVVLLGIVMVFGYRARDKGFNIIAFAALAIGIYCISLEIFIRLGMNLPITLSWSVIVAASLLPFALILLFFHYRLKRGTSLRKFFHL
ncbi:MAG: hypothetical protein HN352_00725 [Bacteroidetes bacterium]|nr:hypothetical protein [Bacteroidota bacterium]MBT3750828.1 hypothetical protein [Bacteroidota bacterium]MBT4398328.1 hypothetical protein [Bacteroidota bacterium]MBT7092167.1 hypothetical protein [Bacteroidota bacterium]MBT7463181.1 hypothetical protein [Bacteroidota bacterium]